MTLYSLRTALDDYRITKFDRDLNVESSYLIGPIGGTNIGYECECPAGTRSTCRHRQMLPNLLPLLDTEYFWDFERGVAVDANGNLRPPEPASGFSVEMQHALELDGEKLLQLTGEDHGPVFLDEPTKPASPPWRRI